MIGQSEIPDVPEGWTNLFDGRSDLVVIAFLMLVAFVAWLWICRKPKTDKAVEATGHTPEEYVQMTAGTIRTNERLDIKTNRIERDIEGMNKKHDAEIKGLREKYDGQFQELRDKVIRLESNDGD